MCSKSLIRAFIFALAFLGADIALAQAPSFNYPAGAHNYTTGSSIAPLTPNTLGGPIPPTIYGQVTTFAGDGTLGKADGTGTAAGISGPVGITLDKKGNLYVTDYYVKGVPYFNNLIRKITTPGAVVTTLAGTGDQGYVNGAGTIAQFSVPNGVAVDDGGNVYVADVDNNVIRKITPDGTVSTFAGTGTRGNTNGAGTVATFNAPTAIAIDAASNLYVTDYANDEIRKITPGGIVSTLAGNGNSGFTNGTGALATFSQPNGIVADPAGNVYVSDAGNSVIRKITPAGLVTTYAGTGTAGSADGTANAASFRRPAGLTIDQGGNIYVADAANNEIRRISASGQVTTLAGAPALGSVNGIGTAASFNDPEGAVIDANATIYVGDKGNNLVRKINGGGYTITPALPAGLNFDGTSGIISGNPLTASPSTTYTITGYNAFGSSTAKVTIAVTGGTIVQTQAPAITYVTPQVYKVNLTIPPLSPTNSGGAVPAETYANVSIFVGNGMPGFVNNTGVQALFNSPSGTAVDAAGNVYVADQANNAIRKITPAGVVTTLAGTGVAGSSNGPGNLATFNKPLGIAVDASGNVYVADTGNNLIREISPTGQVTTFATGFNFPTAVAVDGVGNVYVADMANNVIKKILPSGNVSVFAGNGSAVSADGLGTGASFSSPTGIAIDASGYLYVSDAGSNKIRKITPGGLVSTLAGNGAAGSADGTGTAASFKSPSYIAVNALGDLYVADSGNQTIRKITPAGVVTTLAGSAGNLGRGNGQGTAATFNDPRGMAIDAHGNIFVGDLVNNIIREITTNGYTISPGLPAGLTFNNTTGVISGTPTAASPATNYTITAYNQGGSSTYVVNITVNAPIIVAVPPPDISYETPQSYVVNTAIPPLEPANIGGAVPATIYGQVSTFAGSGAAGSANGTGAAASFSGLNSVATDLVGNVYITDNNQIRKISPSGVVSTLAGSTAAGSANGTGAAASFNQPSGITVDESGNVFVADTKNNVIRMVTQSGQVTTVAGTVGVAGLTNGTGTAAKFNAPTGIVVDDQTGNIYVADAGNNQIREIAPNGVVTTFATGFNDPVSITIDQNGNLCVADAGSKSVKKITPAGAVSTFATGFTNPLSVSADVSGNVYVADANSNIIKKITPAGQVSTLAGSGAAGAANGPVTTASFNHPDGVSADIFGNVYVTDPNNFLVRKIVTTGYTISPGLPPGLVFDGKTGTISGTPTAQSPTTIYTVTAYNTGGSSTTTISITVSDKIIPPVHPPDIAYPDKIVTYVVGTAIKDEIPVNSGGILPANDFGQTTTIAGNGSAGSADGPGLSASFNEPFGVATDTKGNIYVVDHLNNEIRKITPAGVVTTIAGNGTIGSANGNSTSATFNNPTGIAVDVAGNVYVADVSNNEIRKISPAGVVTTLAGSGVQGAADGPGTAASFSNPAGLAVDGAGNIYVADLSNNLIRKITPGGVVTTLAGSGLSGSADGTGKAASFNQPYGVAVDLSGNVYVADWGNNEIRKITPAGVVTTVAGNITPGDVDGQGTDARFNKPFGIAVDSKGNIYVVDTGSEKIKKITPAGLVTTVAGDGSKGAKDGPAAQASFYQPVGIVSDGAGDVYIADEFNNLIRRVVVIGNYTIDKALPPGLTFDPETGKISGTPTEDYPTTTYNVTATNDGGSSTTQITLTVQPAPVLPQTITFAPIPDKTYGDPDFEPGATSTNTTIPITYTSSDPTIATIVNGKVHITGTGTITITASQAGNAGFTAATPVPQQLVINKAPLTATANDASKTFGTPNPKFSVTYTGFVYGENDDVVTTKATVETDATTNSPVGQYVLTPVGAEAANYIITPVTGTLTINPAPPVIVIPNTFTPNGDGVNDVWKIDALLAYPQCIVSIYTRYGNLIYQSKGYPAPWDGTYNGSKLPDGTYYYIIKPGTSTKPLAGSVTIIR